MNSLSIKPAVVNKVGSFSWLLRWASEFAAEERKRGFRVEDKSREARGKLESAAWEILLAASEVAVELSPLVSSPGRSMLKLVMWFVAEWRASE